MTERINLLIHLLCLRPLPEDVQQWNGNTAEFNNSHAYRSTGHWTSFLRGLTPLSLFDEVFREPQEKVERRPELVNEIFRVAELEEGYSEDANGRSTASSSS